ncbi:MAG: UDP-2,4-diacetamido-2,4,6-trideoxy-beta-L-altropyranose hydrolase [Helicobacteraceae bacterium]|jgi:UDP-2,4-diacetamido-2,4,6-trideoxy-beta-L-altropyranose hydrolase|nr:UDP-2,4-diacetamido-2,4,6-trideoxy-beta-L-altropyranose hydrolase [Helicobacteraceae bacterium]
MKFLFRADASTEIGSGHLMRCLTLANALRKLGAKSVFMCDAIDDVLRSRVTQSGFSVTTKVSESFDYLVVDQYSLDHEFENKMHVFCKRVVAIDDLANRKHMADYLLDQNVNASAERYKTLVSERCVQLLGTRYALLQPEYSMIIRRERTNLIKKIFVYFGNADRDNFTGRAIDAYLALRRPDISLEIVLSGVHQEVVRKLAKKGRNIHIHENLTSLASLMNECDLAIGAGGATSYERCAMGLFSIVVAIADNQRAPSEELGRQGLIRYLGYRDRVDTDHIARALQEVVRTGIKTEIIPKMRALVDGFGAQRVAEILMLSEDTELSVREAAATDERWLFDLENEKYVRDNMQRLGAIDPNDYHKWFVEWLGDRSLTRVYVIKAALAVGFVRFVCVGHEWQIFFALSNYARGRSIGKKAFSLALKTFLNQLGNVPLFAKILPSNTAACKVFDGLRFVKTRGEDGTVVYRDR